MTSTVEGSGLGLPPYLGFGLLDPDSVAESDGARTARYVRGNEIVYEVRVTDGRSEIVEYFEGEEIGRTTGRRLSEAFLMRLFGLSDPDHPRISELRSRYGADRNIYIDIRTDPTVAVFPAGLILSLRHPILADNFGALEALAERLESAGESAPLKLHGLHEGCVLKLAEGGEVLCEEVALAEYSTILVHLEQALEWCCASGVVPSEREYRLTVRPIVDIVGGNSIVYLGDRSRGFLTFSVLQIPRVELETNNVEQLFRQASEQLFDQLSNSIGHAWGRHDALRG